MKSLSQHMSKEAIKPSSGIYYAVPTDSTFSMWEIRYRRDDEDWSEELLHYTMWPAVAAELEKRFKLPIGMLDDKYTSMPRGRIGSPQDMGGDKWIVAHGDDAPAFIRHQVLSAFGLLGLVSVGKVEWRVSNHEKMNPVEQKFVWSLLKKKKR